MRINYVYHKGKFYLQVKDMRGIDIVNFLTLWKTPCLSVSCIGTVVLYARSIEPEIPFWSLPKVPP